MKIKSGFLIFIYFYCVRSLTTEQILSDTSDVVHVSLRLENSQCGETLSKLKINDGINDAEKSKRNRSGNGIPVAINCVQLLPKERILRDTSDVVHVSLIYRHGERTPEVFAPNDPYNDLKYWPEGFGQLTEAGKTHHFFLGKWLRKRYNHLIGYGKYHVKTMCTLSTDYDRTLMSASANLAGMFWSSEKNKYTNLQWEPVPIHSTSLETDKTLAMACIESNAGCECKAYTDEIKRFQNSAEFKKMDSRFTGLYKYLTESTGFVYNNTIDVQYLYDTLLIEEIANLPLPEWTKKVYPDKLRFATDYSFSLPTYTTKMKRFKSGPLLKVIRNKFQDKIRDGELQLCSNISAFSAHDDNVANLLNTLGVFNQISVPFAALVLVELRKSANNIYSVTTLYQNSTDPNTEPFLLELPNCGGLSCPFNKFVNNLKPVIPDDFDKECQQS